MLDLTIYYDTLIHIMKPDFMKKLVNLDLEHELRILKALAHPIRLRIACGLCRIESCNVKNIWECLELKQSNASQHLSLMRNLGVLKATREGMEIKYSIQDPKVKKIVDILIEDKKCET